MTQKHRAAIDAMNAAGELQTLSDFDLAVRLHETMERHDRLIDSAPMGDERIYFANKECEALKAEQSRRGYLSCEKCFDFGEVTDMHGDCYGFCDCAMGEHFKAKAERRAAKVEAGPSVQPDLDIEKAAIILWHRFSPSHHELWEEEPHKSEYRLAAQEIAALSSLRVEGVRVDEEALDKAAREGYAVRCKTNGPRVLEKYAADDIMAMQLANARVIVSAYLAARSNSTRGSEDE